MQRAVPLMLGILQTATSAGDDAAFEGEPGC
jgi:hypothetical protein